MPAVFLVYFINTNIVLHAFCITGISKKIKDRDSLEVISQPLSKKHAKEPILLPPGEEKDENPQHNFMAANFTCPLLLSVADSMRQQRQR